MLGLKPLVWLGLRERNNKLTHEVLRDWGFVRFLFGLVGSILLVVLVSGMYIVIFARFLLRVFYLNSCDWLVEFGMIFSI